MESILDPNHPVQAQMEEEGWNQLRNGELVQNKGVVPYVDHEDRVWRPVTRDQRRILKTKSRAEKRHHKLNSQRIETTKTIGPVAGRFEAVGDFAGTGCI